MAYKRKFSSGGPSSYAKRAKTTRGRTRGNRSTYKLASGSTYKTARIAARGVQRLTRMIETKESSQLQTVGTQCPHNNITLLGINPFYTITGVGDPMAGTGNRVGDSISVKGLLIRGFIENTLGRAQVHYRIMLVRGAKGETFDRATLFKGIVDNKLIDQMNSERFTIVASKRMTVNSSNNVANAVGVNGVPSSGTPGGITGRPFSMWVPGSKFGRDGRVTYENNSPTQVKFYDYRIVILAYDWYGTPQDASFVGLINSMYTKMYYKDA